MLLVVNVVEEFYLSYAFQQINEKFLNISTFSFRFHEFSLYTFVMDCNE